MRLDKFLANAGAGTRSEVKKYVRAGRVLVNGVRASASDMQIDENGDEIRLDGKAVRLAGVRYFMLNKPAGTVSATKDDSCRTVLELLEGVDKRGLFPVGRLDKDTEGLLLITDDGALAHFMLSPSRHVDKIYVAQVTGQLGEEHVKKFAEGIELSDFTALPARLEILEAGESTSLARVTLHEGKFHQVKRMFHATGCEVTALKRVSFGSLRLDESLKPGQFRELDSEEIDNVRRDIGCNI